MANSSSPSHDWISPEIFGEDGYDARGPGRFCGIEAPGKHWAPANLMQGFCQRGFHPFALTGGENDGCDIHGLYISLISGKNQLFGTFRQAVLLQAA